MSSAQKEVHDEIVAGRRGRFGGPFQILIHAPEVCRHLQRLGEYLLWGSSLPPALSELAICLTARHLRANIEWHAHAPLTTSLASANGRLQKVIVNTVFGGEL
jgi:4-carboxymuconolactone decarboxylase